MGGHKFNLLYADGYGSSRVKSSHYQYTQQAKEFGKGLETLAEGVGEVVKFVFGFFGMSGCRERSTYVCPEKDGITISTGTPHKGDMTFYRCITGTDKHVFKSGGLFCADGAGFGSSTAASACAGALNLGTSMACGVVDEAINDVEKGIVFSKYDHGMHLYNHRIKCD